MMVLVMGLCALTLTGCERRCESSLQLAVMKALDSHLPSYGSQSDYSQTAENLRRLLDACEFSESGVTVGPDYVLSATEVYILAVDLEQAEQSLQATLGKLDERQGTQLLGTAARYGDLSILRTIVEGGVDVTLQDEFGHNALTAVPGGRQSKIGKAEFLLNNGLELDHQTKDGFSVLDVAIFSGVGETLTWLLEQLDSDNEEHVNLVGRSLEIASTIDSPFSGEVDEWLRRPENVR